MAEPVIVNGKSQANFGGYSPTEVIEFVNGTVNYAAGDVIAAGNAVVYSFKNFSVNNGYIPYLKLDTTDSAATGTFRFHFFTADPGLADGDAFAITTPANYIGYIEGTLATIGGKKEVFGVFLQPFYYWGGKVLYPVIETVTGFNSADAETYTLRIGMESNIDNGYPASLVNA